jgi:uncharacterized membrane protein
VEAAALTLLILEIAVPATTSNAGLPRALLALWPRYLAYLVSFVVIARFWATHRLAFRLIARDDAVLVWLNLLMLMFVAFLPFPTDVSARPAARLIVPRPGPGQLVRAWPARNPCLARLRQGCAVWG